MAAPANTYLSSGAVGNRETLSNIVSRITPEDTPIYSDIPHGKLDGTHPEWEIDALAPPAANVQPEGDEYTFAATTPPVRVGNYAQIFRKTGIVSNTQEAVSNAGDIEKLAEQKIKKGVELRKDVELSIVSNTASVGGATRVSGGLASWLTTNASRGAGGANGGFNQTTKLTVADTIGTQRALTKGLIDTTMGQVYSSGGNVRTMYTAPYVKSVYATLMSDANVAPQRSTAPAGREMTVNGSVETYLSPYGEISIKMDRVMANAAAVARRAFLIDPEYLSFDWLRPIQEDRDLAKTGDNKKFVIHGEGALRVKNEGAIAVIADIFGISATV